MKLAQQIRNKIDSFPKGKAFGYADLDIANNEYISTAKTLERLQTKGTIKKISKGKFYKPEQSIFGELQPHQQELLKPYLFENNKRIAYITGFSLYHQMGLTTQISNSINIASRSKRIYINQGALKATAVKSYEEVTDTNYKLLGLLDALKDIKRIPDSKITNSILRLEILITELDNKQLENLCKYALSYPPRVRALLGAICDKIDRNINTLKLQKSLNPLTKIKLGISNKDLPTLKNWNIE